MISTVILKPTCACNADCEYCASPPDGEGAWTFDDFRLFFNRLAPHLAERVVLLWHGGEPMLLGPDFYRRCFDHATRAKSEIRFSIQTNLLLYDSRRWRDVFADIMAGSISTSFDPGSTLRTLKGDPVAYRTRFLRSLDAVLGDGFRPLVIGTYGEEDVPLAQAMYDLSLSHGSRAFDLRFNYRYPAGRAAGEGEAISPGTYGAMLIGLYERWVREVPRFSLTPLDLMVKRVAGLEDGRCPWTRQCGGRFLSIEPNGNVHNCAEFADLGDPGYRFGNLRAESVPELLASEAAVQARRRRIEIPCECVACRHFAECEAGCMRDAVLFGHGADGRFHYCAAWKLVFDRIKESILSGEADDLISRLGGDGATARRRVA